VPALVSPIAAFIRRQSAANGFNKYWAHHPHGADPPPFQAARSRGFHFALESPFCGSSYLRDAKRPCAPFQRHEGPEMSPLPWLLTSVNSPLAGNQCVSCESSEVDTKLFPIGVHAHASANDFCLLGRLNAFPGANCSMGVHSPTEGTGAQVGPSGSAQLSPAPLYATTGSRKALFP